MIKLKYKLHDPQGDRHRFLSDLYEDRSRIFKMEDHEGDRAKLRHRAAVRARRIFRPAEADEL